jgi:hypothetical protein
MRLRRDRWSAWVAPVILVVVGVAVFGPYAHSGVFLYDDWSFGALARFRSFGTAVSAVAETDPGRPLAAVYFPLLHIIVGTHHGLYLAWAIALRIVMGVVIYAVLRELGLNLVVAGGAAMLAMLFTWSDATWLWGTASQLTLSVILWQCGLLVALRARRARWHVGALVLYASSVLLYELTLPAILLGGVLYLLRHDRRGAVERWSADAVLAVVLLVLFSSGLVQLIPGHNVHIVQSAHTTVVHLRTIIHQAALITAASLVPFGAPGTLSEVVAAAVLLTCCVGAWLTRGRSPAARWLAVSAASLVVIAAGYVMLIPASDYYDPLAGGVANRINVVAAVGYALLAASVGFAIATAVASVLPRPDSWAPVIAAILIAAIAAGYARSDLTDERTYEAASHKAEHVLARLRRLVPTPPHGSLILADGFNPWQATNVPVFSASWDLNGAVKLLWNDPSLSGEPVDGQGPVGRRLLECVAGGVAINGLGANADVGSPPFVAYEHVIVANVSSGQVSHPISSRGCLAAIDTPGS